MKTLSAAQTKFLTNLATRNATTFAYKTAANITFDILVRLGLAEMAMTEGLRGREYAITPLGRETLASLTAQPAEAIAPTAATEDESAAELIAQNVNQALAIAIFGESAAIEKGFESADEPTGPDHTEAERAAMDTFDPEYDYMEMKPMDVKRYMGIVTAQLAGRSWVECPALGEGRHKFFTIDASGDVQIGSIVEFETDYQYPGLDGTYWWLKNVCVIDPRDAEITALKAEIAALKAQLAATPMEELQRWHEGRSTYIVTLLSPSEDESYIFEDAFRTRSEAVLEGQRIRNENYRGWSIFVKEKYPDELPFEEENQNYNADLGLGGR